MRLQTALIMIFGWLLRLYPCAFRAEFEAELRAVFAEAVRDSAENGTISLMITFLRELRDLPLALWREHTATQPNVALVMGNIQTQPLLLLGDTNEPGTRRDAWLAAVPALFIALITAVPRIFYAFEIVPWPQNGLSLWQSAAMILGAVALLALLIFAWRNGWPRWSGSWYLYWCIALALPFLFLLSTWPPAVDLNNSLIFLFVVAPWLVVVWLFKIMRHDPFKGLLLALPVVTTFWSPVREFVDPRVREPITMLVWFLMAMAAYVIVRRGNLRLGVLLTVGVSLVNGVLISTAQVYRHSSPMGQNPNPSLGEVVAWFAPTMIGTAALVLGMLMAWLIWQFGRNLGHKGRWGAFLILIALFFNLGSFLTSWWVAAELDNVRLWIFDHDASTVALGALFNASLLIYLTGVGLLVASMWAVFSAEKTIILGVLLLTPIGLPFLFAFPFIFLMNWTQLEFPSIMAQLTALSGESLIAIGAIWLTIAIGLLVVSRRWLVSAQPA